MFGDVANTKTELQQLTGDSLPDHSQQGGGAIVLSAFIAISFRGSDREVSEPRSAGEDLSQVLVAFKDVDVQIDDVVPILWKQWYIEIRSVEPVDTEPEEGDRGLVPGSGNSRTRGELTWSW